MRTFASIIALVTVLTCACSTISLKQTASFPLPPVNVDGSQIQSNPIAQDHWLEARYRANPSDSMRYLVRYHQAKIWSAHDLAKACALWLDSAKNPIFPLSHLARIRALETCPASRTEGIPSLDEVMATTPEPWLEDTLIRAAHHRAVTTRDEKWELKLSTRVASIEKSQTRQIELYERAIALAKKLGEPEIETLALGELQKIAPRLIKDPKPQQFLQIASDFRRARLFDKAREYYALALNDAEVSAAEKLRALDGIRMTYKLELNTDKFIEATRGYADFARTNFFLRKPTPGEQAGTGRYFDAFLTLARAVWTDNSPTEASKILSQVERDLKGKHPLYESVLIRARIEEEARRYVQAVKIVSKLNLTKSTDSAFRQKALWFKAWNLRKLGRFKEAKETLELLLADENATSSGQPSRTQFWLARTLNDLKEFDRAKSIFESLTKTDPIGFYGNVSYRELGRKLPPIRSHLVTAPEVIGGPLVSTPSGDLASPGVEAFDPATSPLDIEQHLISEWLIATGESEIGRKFLDHATRGRRSQLNETQSLMLLQTYARSGNYLTLFSRLYELTPETRAAIIERRPDVLFPRPHLPVVEAAAKKHGVDAALIYSIMRQESAFDPRARSHADAFGLLQLIPSNAVKAARADTAVKYATHEDLYRPEVNIPLGTVFMRDLLKQWDGKFIPSVASYNASEKAVTGWLRTRDRRDPIQFIEEVPYEETRNYLKLVTRNFVFYSRMASDSEIAFPEWCLTGLQGIKP